MAQRVTRLEVTAVRSVRETTSRRENDMHHLRLGFKAGSAQTPTLGPCGRLKRQLGARSFWNVQTAATCDKRVFSLGSGSARPQEAPTQTQRGRAHAERSWGLPRTFSRAAGGTPSPGRAPGKPQRCQQEGRDQARGPCQGSPTICPTAKLRAGLVSLGPSCTAGV